ncbi:hypothetical protein FD724_07325 [Nostoc sp. C057]|jgi:hypothetical protein|uniref:hypothetical protein n=1 Tax=Nostoc sp. C057 TaxID=2576903 RepID=UPI0015C3F200|nr:hypothetical protein [Nostoc sp. C057]QLE47946.1 hypothetical protein FD724_07325 [Nostoc sp. C057]
MTLSPQQLSISIPSDWTPPKYRLGQWVKEGLIVGCTYYHAGSKPAYQYKQTWRYCVLPDEQADAEDIKYFLESEITPLTSSELQTKIQALVDFHSSRITALTEQLTEAFQS